MLCLARLSLLAVLLLAGGLPAPVGHAAAAGQALQDRYQQFLSAAYAEAVEAAYYSPFEDASYDKILRNILNRSGPDAIGHALANMGAITTNLNHDRTLDLVRHLLEQDARFLVDGVLGLAQRQGDRYLLAKLHFETARYYLNRSEWDRCAQHLQQIGIRNALTQEQRDYAGIMQGIILQRQSQHRDAIPFYKAVPPESPHYPVAQLNLATVFIRQDWWTDGHLAIDAALDATPDKTLRDRLYTVLGFSQLQKEFYRDARHSFRRVRTDSPYSERALFGLGLAALHQRDYPAALNAFDLLKEQAGRSKSSAEAFLLSAVTLEQMGQFGAASAAYTEALAHFENRSRQIGGTITTAREQNELAEKSASSADGLLTPRIPPYLKQVSSHLLDIRQFPLSRERRNALENLIADYRQLEERLTLAGLEETQEMIRQYLNQARFGLARLHDSSD